MFSSIFRYDFIPTVLNRDLVDTWMKSEDNESLNLARELIRREGLLCGGSSGAALWAALKIAKDLPSDKRVVVLLPDSIRNYMTKFISDEWMETRDFLVKSHIPWYHARARVLKMIHKRFAVIFYKFVYTYI